MSENTDERTFFGASSRTELLATIILSLAAILTAWTGFQSAKWSGEQAKSFSRAGAVRTESTRFDARANQQTAIDVQVFTTWLVALDSDVKAGRIPPVSEVDYTPTPGTLSGFLYERVRDEFRPAFDAWIASYTENPDDAPGSPFDMEEYTLANRAEAERLLIEAQGHTEDASRFNENSDRYVLTTVLFALVLFFAGISSKLKATRNQQIMVGMATVMFIAGVVIVFLLPIHQLIG